MKQGIEIKVSRKPDDDGLFKFNIILSNGKTFTSLDFWDYSDNLKGFGRQLMDFPQGLKDTVTYELGENANEKPPKWSYYLLLNVFCFEPSGQSAIKVIVNDNSEIPDCIRSEFYIKSDVASLNRFGRELCTWNPEDDKPLNWFSDEHERSKHERTT